MNTVILWRRLDLPGHDCARLVEQQAGWRLEGSAVFAYRRLACRLDYWIQCDAQWRTRAARVQGWLGEMAVDIDLSVDSHLRWFLNKEEIFAVEGCIDLDLNFSPCTNLLPIRRLDLAVGQAVVVRAAWLSFPELILEPLNQRYHRTRADTYHYESDGNFVRDLKVNPTGFVTHYPGFWQEEELAGA